MVLLEILLRRVKFEMLIFFFFVMLKVVFFGFVVELEVVLFLVVFLFLGCFEIF